MASWIKWGPCESDGVRVELNAEPPPVSDREYPKFFHAIIERDDVAMLELQDLASGPDYVHRGGPMPSNVPVEATFITRKAINDDRGQFDVV
jgi:hypothetical protein